MDSSPGAGEFRVRKRMKVNPLDLNPAELNPELRGSTFPDESTAVSPLHHNEHCDPNARV
jgi:hypothetical protein